MDRFTITCRIADQDQELQFDKKAMPGETGPCYMITAAGCFKGYIARQRNGTYDAVGASYYTPEDMQVISIQLNQLK